MTLQQLGAVKRWHITHHRQDTVEYHLWDTLLTCWVLGWMGVAPALLLAQRAALLACAGLYLAPGAYVRLRSALHRRGLVRCDWLGCLKG